MQSGPPKPIPKPGQVKVVRALYKYKANQADELSFEEGDTLYIVDMTTDLNWWKAKCGNKTGYIPSNYVEENTESIVHPLHESAKRGNLSFLEECLSNGVSVNSLDKAGSTALHWASHGGHIECMQKLLNVPKIQINVKNRLGDTPLHSAAWKGQAEAVKLLLEKGVKTNLLNNENQNAFDLARDPTVCDLLRPFFRKSATINDYGESSGDSD